MRASVGCFQVDRPREKPRIPLSWSAPVLWTLGGGGSSMHAAKAHGLLATALCVLRKEHDTRFAVLVTQGLPGGGVGKLLVHREVPGWIILHVFDRLPREQGAHGGHCPVPKISGMPKHHQVGPEVPTPSKRARDQTPAFSDSRRSVTLCVGGLGSGLQTQHRFILRLPVFQGDF